jgi:aldose 1-epimerase
MRKRAFGRHDGRPVEEIVLESADAAVAILSYGCVLRDWRVDGPEGSLPMVLGFRRLEDYEQHARSHGAIVGRIANRTANAAFELDGRTYHLTRNHGAHHIHGCLGRVVWEMEADAGADAVRLRYLSPDGEDGYPGAVAFAVTYRLQGPRLTCEMSGRPDRPTPINLAHHAYFNAGGGGTVQDHVLRVEADAYTPLGPDSIPLGTIAPVEGTALDFREPRAIGDTAIDNNFVLRPGRDLDEPAAAARCPRTGLAVRVRTDQPGLQVFDAPSMTIGAPGHDGQHYGPFAGLCFEAQHFPDSMHHPDWPSIVCTPEAPYFQRYVVEIGPDGG